MNKKSIFTIGLIIYLIIVFSTEIIYRERLYKFSVEYIDKIDQDGFFHKISYFWSFIFFYLMQIIGIYITLFFYPITVGYCHISLEVIMVCIIFLFKSVYTSPRPYWDIYIKRQEDATEKLRPPTECDPEFGNPSGHTFLSTYLLILWNLFINSKFIKDMEGRKKIFIKYITFILSLLCIVFIAYSRINRQVHSFNQILLGFLLGCSIFFSFCYILELNTVDTNTFMEALDKYKFILLPIFILFFALSVILGFTRHNKNEEKYQKILQLYCDIANKDEMFGKLSATFSSILFIVIGGYLGLLFLKYKIVNIYPDQKNLFYNWNKTKFIKKIIISLFSVLLPSIVFIPAYFVPIKYYLIKLFLIALCCLIYGFCLFGFNLYYGCVLFKLPKTEESLLENSENTNINSNGIESINENNSDQI